MKFKILIKSIILFSIPLFSTTANCQLLILQDNMGTPFFENNKNIYEGSPWLFQDWLEAKAYPSKTSTNFYLLKINYHAATGKLLYMVNNTPMEFTSFIATCTVNNNDKEIQFIHAKAFNANENFYFETLYTKKDIYFLKKNKKNLTERYVYNSPDKNYEYTVANEYYIFANNQLNKIKLNKDNFQLLLQTFAIKKSTNLNYKSEADWIAFLNAN